MKNYPIGTYYFTALPVKPRHKAIIRLKRRNKTHRSNLTIYRKEKQQKEMLVALIFMIALLSANVAYAQFISLANSITINGGAVKVSTPRTSPFVEQSSEVVKPKATASLAVMIGNNEIENYIVKEAIKHGVNPTIAVKIARCENSNLNPSLKNPNPNSTATGIYQWTIGSWKYYSKMFWNDTTDYRKDYKKNIELAMLTMQKYGFKDWKASESCWSF